MNELNNLLNGIDTLGIILSTIIAILVAYLFYKKTIQYTNQRSNCDTLKFNLNNILNLLETNPKGLDSSSLEARIYSISAPLKLKLEKLLVKKNQQDKFDKLLEMASLDIAKLNDKELNQDSRDIYYQQAISRIKEMLRISSKDCSKEELTD